MKDFKKETDQEENEQKQEIDIQSLTGSPSPTAVSEVAMGGKAKTLMQHDEDEQVEWINRLKGGDDPKVAEIKQAYANIFEGLAVISRDKNC